MVREIRQAVDDAGRERGQKNQLATAAGINGDETVLISPMFSLRSVVHAFDLQISFTEQSIRVEVGLRDGVKKRPKPFF